MIFQDLFLAQLPEELRSSPLAQTLAIVGNNFDITLASKVESEFLSRIDVPRMKEAALLDQLAFLGVRVPSFTPASASLVIKNDSAVTVSFAVGDVFFDTSARSWTVTAALTLSPGQSDILLMQQFFQTQTTQSYTKYLAIEETGIVSDTVLCLMLGSQVPLLGSAFSNGFNFYVASDVLYLKIYPGESVADPDGKDVTVIYNKSDGVLEGGLSFDVTGWRPFLNLISFTWQNGSNRPALSDLQSLYRLNVLSNNKLVRRKDYQDFIQSDTRVAEAFVIGDYEKRILTGKFEPSGIVTCYAIDTESRPITTALQEELLNEMAEYKDISIVEFKDPAPSQLRLYAFYETISGLDAEFEALVTANVRDVFYWDTVRASGGSLFSALDVSDLVTGVVNSKFTPAYFTFRIAFISKFSVSPSVFFAAAVPTPNELEVGAVSVWDITDGKNELWATPAKTSDTPGIYEMRRPDGTVCGLLDYNTASLQIVNDTDEPIDMQAVFVVLDPAKVKMPDYSVYRTMEGLYFFKGVSPLKVELLPVNPLLN